MNRTNDIREQKEKRNKRIENGIKIEKRRNNEKKKNAITNNKEKMQE